MKLVRPWLPHAHRNFFVIYAAVLIAHLGMGWDAVTSGSSFRAIPGYTEIVKFMSPEAWGVVSLGIGVLMYVSLHLRTFKLARIALLLGTVWSMLLFILLIAAQYIDHITTVGWGKWVWMVVVMVHVSMLLEPPVNPESTRERNT